MFHELPITGALTQIYAFYLFLILCQETAFFEIRSALHFNDNDAALSRDHLQFDRACKIRTIIQHFNKSFSQAIASTKKQSVDEKIVMFKGNNRMKRFNMNKPFKEESLDLKRAEHIAASMISAEEGCKAFSHSAPMLSANESHVQRGTKPPFSRLRQSKSEIICWTCKKLRWSYVQRLFL